MAQQFSVNITRNENKDKIKSELCVWDDDTIEIVTPDSNCKADYLIRKQIFIKDLAIWARTYGVTKLEFTDVSK